MSQPVHDVDNHVDDNYHTPLHSNQPASDSYHINGAPSPSETAPQSQALTNNNTSDRVDKSDVRHAEEIIDSELPPAENNVNILSDYYHRIRRMIVREKVVDPTALLDIAINDPSFNRRQKFPSNVIKTTKYTVLTFLFINLFEQFRRLANAYFLIIVLLQIIPQVSPFPIYTSLAPLIFVLSIGALNEAFEDWSRHRADNEANNRQCRQVDGGKVQTLKSANIKAGQILEVLQNEEFPADLMLISSGAADGTCYVNTANLDGEAAPKVRVSPVQTMNARSYEDLSQLTGHISVEQPSASMYHLQGSVDLQDPHDSSHVDQFPIGDKQLLLRGSKLVNTPKVYGLVVYTGQQTKLLLNRSVARYKFSRFEQRLNKLVVAILIFNAVICLMPSIYLVAHNHDWENTIVGGWTSIAADSFVGWLLGYITLYILFSWMVPISLYVTIALVKVAQAKLMEWDLDMSIDSVNDDTGAYQRKYMKVKAAALNEELGTIDAICSDKTGTLTQNKMELSRVSVRKQLFYDKVSDYEQHKVYDHPDAQTGEKYLADLCLNAYKYLIDGHGESTPVSSKSNSASTNSVSLTQRQLILCILLCNGVLPSVKQNSHHDSDTSSGVHGRTMADGGNDNDSMTATEATIADLGKSTVVEFQSQSPDEIALCESLHRCGITMLSRTGNNASIRINLPGMVKPVVQTYNILATLDFSSVWRRMSVVVEDKQGQIHVYTKGADSTIKELIDMSAEGVADLWKQTDSHAREFAISGSRTLMFSGCSITRSQYEEWYPQFNKAQLSMTDREAHVERSFSSIEHNMQLLGCSAVDDQLQQHVPECIDFLLAAGLKVIVVTGDKKETAVTIARQAHLIHADSNILYLNGVTREECKQSLVDCLTQLSLPTSAEVDDLNTVNIQSVSTTANSNTADNSLNSLAVDGVCLELLLAYDRTRFLRAFNHVSSIVCYRSTPLQKAMVVRLVKKDMGLTTLAIGDGANDVSMILEAHVGVGILGKEGAHAAMSSDFVIHRFGHLKKLLFVHGRNNYFRLIQVVLFSFYKNLAYQLPLFWFTWWSLGSGTTMFDSILQTCWNLFFTSVPPFFVGVFDVDVLPHVLLRIPAAYPAFKRNNTFKTPVFLYILLISVYQSVLSYFITYAFFYNNEILSNGQGGGLYYVGHTLLTALVITINLWMLVNAEHINSWMVGGVLFMWLWYMGVFLYVPTPCWTLLVCYSYMTMISQRSDAGVNKVAQHQFVFVRLTKTKFVTQTYQLTLSPAAFGTGLLFTQAGPWLVILSVTVASLLPDTLLLSYRKLYKPYTFEQLQRLEKIPISMWPKQIHLFQPYEPSQLVDDGNHKSSFDRTHSGDEQRSSSKIHADSGLSGDATHADLPNKHMNGDDEQIEMVNGRNGTSM